MKNFDRQINRDFSNAAILCAGSVYPITGGNDSSRDYWKLMSNGDLVDDGDGWLRDQNGNLVTDSNGNKIGANGKETGLLNILYGGTNNVSYNSYSDAQISSVQQLMMNAGMIHSGETNMRARNWNGSTGTTIVANTLLSGYGDTVAAPVFINGYDKATDTVLFSGNFSQVDKTLLSVPQISQKRFQEYLGAKASFYGGVHSLFNSTEGLSLSQQFQQSASYNGNQHRGGDVSGPYGTKIKAGYSGKVTENYTSDTAGNSLVVEYGFLFENSFYSTGIQGQFMHLVSNSAYTENKMVKADSVIGKMGNTGWVEPAPTLLSPTAGTHLHYQLMGNLSNTGPSNTAWSMLNGRRDVFLSQIGAPLTPNYVVNQGTSTLNNYTGSVGSPVVNYNNFFYNPNEWLRRMGL
jgi:murein DD-endopeptidase MepM/ murein hydrolase activator NlpD